LVALGYSVTGRDSSVGIAIRYTLVGPGIESGGTEMGWGKIQICLKSYKISGTLHENLSILGLIVVDEIKSP
jgi:hypothetical protein